MKKLFLIIVLFFIGLIYNTGKLYAQYDSFLNQSYCGYRDKLEELYITTWHKNYSKEEEFKAWDSVIDFARNNNDKKLELLSEYHKENYFRYKYNHLNKTISPNGILARYRKLFEKAKQINFPEMEALALKSIIDFDWGAFKRDKLCIENCIKLKKILEKIPDETFPDKKYCYGLIGEVYYYFQDYKTAITYLDKAIKVPFSLSNEIFIRDQMSVLNTIGLCYRRLNLLDSSNYYFLSILNDPNLQNNHAWEIIAKGNLGKNYFYQNKLDEALPLLICALEEIDQTFIQGVAIVLSEIYMRQNKLGKAKEMLDLSKKYIDKLLVREMLKNWHVAMTRYYILKGMKKEAITQLDSALKAEKEYLSESSSIHLLHIEQNQNALERQLKDKQIETGKLQKKVYCNQILSLSIGSIILALISAICLLMYKKKQKAYKMLVQKSKQWANNKDFYSYQLDSEDAINITENEEKDINVGHENIDIVNEEEGRLLMEQIYAYMDSQKPFKDAYFSINTLSEKLKIPKNKLSSVCNHIANCNFKTFVNNYRIREAIKMMSNIKFEKYSIDEIAYASGFNDRTTFYRSFKKITGLSPSDFRKNNLKM